MSSPPAPYFDVNFVDQNDQQTHQLDFTDNPFVAPEEQYRFDLKQWLAFIHEVRAKLSYLQVYALEEGPQIPQLKRVVQDLGDVVEFIDESVGQLTPDDNQKKALYSTSPNSTNKRPFSVPNLRDEYQPVPEPYVTHTDTTTHTTTTTTTPQYLSDPYYSQPHESAEKQAASANWSQTVRPNARHSTTRGWMFELGSSRRAINPDRYRTATGLTSHTEFSTGSGPASSPSLAAPKRRLENSYQAIPLGANNTNYTGTVTASPSVTPVTPSVMPYGTNQLTVTPTPAATQSLGVVTAPVPRTPDMFGPMPPRSATDSAPKVALSPGMTKRRADPGTNYQLIPTSNSAQLRPAPNTAAVTVVPYGQSAPFAAQPQVNNNVTPVTPSVVSYQSTPFASQPSGNVTPVNSNTPPSSVTLSANPKRAPVVYSSSK